MCPVSALTVGAMAIDHLVGTEDEPGDDSGLADPAASLISVAVSLILAALLFGIVVRRAAWDDPDRAARKAIASSLLAVPAIALLFSRSAVSAGRAIVGLSGRLRDRRLVGYPCRPPSPRLPARIDE